MAISEWLYFTIRNYSQDSRNHTVPALNWEKLVLDSKSPSKQNNSILILFFFFFYLHLSFSLLVSVAVWNMAPLLPWKTKREINAIHNKWLSKRFLELHHSIQSPERLLFCFLVVIVFLFLFFFLLPCLFEICANRLIMNEPPLTWHAFHLRWNDSGMVTADYSLDNGAGGMSVERMEWVFKASSTQVSLHRSWPSYSIPMKLHSSQYCVPRSLCIDSYGGDAKMKHRLWSIIVSALRKHLKWEWAIPAARRKYSADEGNHWYLEIDFIAIPFPICGPCAS